MNRTAAIIVCALSLSTVACSGTIHDVVDAHGKGEGTSRIYNVSRDRAWAISHDVLKKEEVDYVEDHATDNYMTAEIKPGLFKYGTFIGVWVTPQGGDHAEVSVVTKRRDMSYFKGLNEGTFHDEFAKALSAPPAPATPAPSVAAAPTVTTH